MIRRPVAALAVALLGVVGLGPVAHADQLGVDDPTNDVVRYESGTPVSEPRVDITRLDIDHQARSLEVAVTVAQLTPLSDPAWRSGMSLYVVLQDPDAEPGSFNGFRVWELVPDGSGGASGQLLSLTDSGITACETSASVDEALRQYVLSADVSCLSGVPRALRFGASMTFDDNVNDDDYDSPSDVAPDDDLTAAVASSGSPFVHRIAGQDRIATAIALSADRFDGGQAASAILASAATFPDAIAGGPLAVARGGPLLLTPTDHLDPRVASELERTLPPGSDVLVLGGSGAISEDVVSAVRDLGLHPRRIAGANRFETAVAIADEIGDHELVAIADGRSFREALVAGAAAAARGGVVVLTDGTTLPGATDDYLAHDPTRHVAMGAAAVAAPGAERITAASVPELSQKVLDRLLPDVGMIAIASDATFADALAGAAHLAPLRGGLLLTDGAQLSAPVADELRARSDGLREIAIYGGTAAVSAAVEDAIVAASGG